MLIKENMIDIQRAISSSYCIDSIRREWETGATLEITPRKTKVHEHEKVPQQCNVICGKHQSSCQLTMMTMVSRENSGRSMVDMDGHAWREETRWTRPIHLDL
jgi:hypothetical protein